MTGLESQQPTPRPERWGRVDTQQTAKIFPQPETPLDLSPQGGLSVFTYVVHYQAYADNHSRYYPYIDRAFLSWYA